MRRVLVAVVLAGLFVACTSPSKPAVPVCGGASPAPFCDELRSVTPPPN